MSVAEIQKIPDVTIIKRDDPPAGDAPTPAPTSRKGNTQILNLATRYVNVFVRDG